MCTTRSTQEMTLDGYMGGKDVLPNGEYVNKYERQFFYS